MTWTPPTSFPNLSAADVIAVDVETCDPHLKVRGPGGVRGDGFLVGVAVAVDQWAGYFPIAHEDGSNIDKALVVRWLNEQLGRPTQAKVGANVLYDLEWLRTAGVNVAGRIFDCLGAEALLDEHRTSYTLDAVAGDRLGKHKDESLLRTIIESKFGKKADPKANLWRLNPRYVGGYAEEDARLALELLAAQRPALENSQLWDLYLLESDLLPLLLEMRFRGVRVDLEKAQQLMVELRKREEVAQDAIDDAAGFHVEVWAAESIARAFRRLALPFPLTEKTQKPSFTRSFLDSHPHPIAKGIVEVRRLSKLRGTFVQKQIIENAHRGRVHCLFHPLRSESGGTVSGRLSCSQPNLQQVPARDELAPLVRAIFLPDEGCEWGNLDYSQIEPRLTVHYACRKSYRGSTKAQEFYLSTPDADYHKMVARMISPDFDSLDTETASALRRAAKTVNLGLAYGMGKKKLAASLGVTIEEATTFLNVYHERVPFIKALTEEAANVATSRGFLRTLLGRIARFPFYERSHLAENEEWEPALPLELAQRRWPNQPLRRAGTYKAMNRLIQGSAADVMKKAMQAVWGLGQVPHITFHDELDLSMPPGDEGAKLLNDVRQAMEQCVTLEVPLLVKTGVGPNWGEAQHD